MTRRRFEIGVLRSLGAEPSRFRAVLLAQGAITECRGRPPGSFLATLGLATLLLAPDITQTSSRMMPPIMARLGGWRGDAPRTRC